MGVAVVTVATGGLAVVDVTATTPRLGLPVTESANGRGIPVTKVTLPRGGLPVTYDGTAFFGLVIAGPENAATPPWPTTADWDYLQVKGVKTVALTIAWENIQTSLNGALATTYLNNLKAAVAAANVRNIGVIVRMQNYGHYANATAWNVTVSRGGNGGTPAANVNYFGDGTLTTAAFADVWTKIVTAFVGLPGIVGWDIMNEPLNLAATANTLPNNKFQTPGYFGATTALAGGNAWFVGNNAGLTQDALGTNPITGYQPSWTLTNAVGGFSGVAQFPTLTAVPTTLSFYVKTDSGTQSVNFQTPFHNGGNPFTATTTWKRAARNATPSAGGTTTGILINNGTTGASIHIANAQLEITPATSTASSITGSVLTVGGTLTGTWAVGQQVVVNDFAVATITSLGTGAGGAGTYNLNISPGNVGSTAISACRAYEPNPYLVFAQAAVTGIRTVDAVTPIYVQGFNYLYSGANWAYVNWEMASMTGGPFIFEAHVYPDGPQGFGNGGTFSGTYTSYSINTSSANQMTAQFVSWLTALGVNGQVGEFGIPNSVADANDQWLVLESVYLGYLKASGVTGLLTFYGANNAGAGSILQMNPIGGVDDPRLNIMLSFKGTQPSWAHP